MRTGAAFGAIFGPVGLFAGSIFGYLMKKAINGWLIHFMSNYLNIFQIEKYFMIC